LVEVDASNQLVSNPIFFNSGHSPNTEEASVKTESLPAPDLPPVTPPAMGIPMPLPAQEEKAIAPKIEPLAVAPIEKYVEVTGRGVRLRKGPSTQFPVVAKVAQGERLLFVRRTDVMLSGKAWIVIQKEREPAYVWEGLVKELPAD
jgi:hypothetical protein